MWILLMVKNIKHFILNKPVMFIFIILSQIVCVITILTITGMMYSITPDPQDERGYFDKMFLINFEHYDYQENSLDQQAMYYYLFDIKENKYVYTGTDSQKANEIEKEYYERGNKEIEQYGDIIHPLSSYSIPVPSDYDSLPLYGSIKEKIYNILNESHEYIYQFYLNGYIGNSVDISFTAEDGSVEYMSQYNNDIISDQNLIKVRKSSYAETPYKNIKEGEMIDVGGKSFRVSNITEQEYGLGQTIFKFLLRNTGEDFKISSISLIIKDTAELPQIEQIKAAIDRNFGGKADIEVPQPKPLLEKQFNNMIYVISAIILVVILLNVMRFYAFVISLRKRSINVFAVCGAGKRKLFVIYVSEILITMCLSFIAGLLLFQFVLISIISRIYPSFEDIFNINTYLFFFGVYMLIGIVIIMLNIMPLFIGCNTGIRRE